MDCGKFVEAMWRFEEIGFDYKDSQAKYNEAKEIYLDSMKKQAISAGDVHTVGLKSDGTVVAVGYNEDGQYDVSDWEDIVAIFSRSTNTVGLKSDGTVKYVGIYKYYGNGQCDVSDWTDIISISAGDLHIVGLKSDGTVVAVGNNKFGQCNVLD